MGNKDQELIEAAATGNISKIERILTSKPKGFISRKSIPIPGLRGFDINCTDRNGDTPLHLAALNGHKDIVALLLQYEASVNQTDRRGCSPLHLAAWNGHTDICSILMTFAPNRADVSIQNGDGDTPLHSAAQYGHIATVTVLLEQGADPSIRNLKDESPLDLAAQYGRLDVVKLLIQMHPEMVHGPISKNSALHLSSRNGHLDVVKILIDSGFNINTKNENGTALHEAAKFGKIEVVKYLLEKGVNITETDGGGETVLDTVNTLKSSTSLQISKIISEYMEKRGSVYSSTSSTTSQLYLKAQNIPCTPPPPAENTYDHPSPRPPPRNSSLPSNSPDPESRSQFYDLEGEEAPILPPKKDSVFMMIAHGETTSPQEIAPPPPRPCTITEGTPPQGYMLMDTNSTSPSSPSQKRPVPAERPKKPERKFSPHEQKHTSPDSLYKVPVPYSDPVPQSDYIDMNRGSIMKEKEDENIYGCLWQTSSIKRKNQSDEHSMGGYANVNAETTNEGLPSPPPACSACNLDEYAVINKVKHEDSDDKNNNGQRVTDNSKPSTLELSGYSISKNIPGISSEISQLPTPDFPPPSPQTAIQDIQSALNKHSISDKRNSRDMQTSTESSLLQKDDAAESDKKRFVSSESKTNVNVTEVSKAKAVIQQNTGADQGVVHKAIQTRDKNVVLDEDTEEVTLRRSSRKPCDGFDISIYEGLLKGSSTYKGPSKVVSKIADNVVIRQSRDPITNRVQSAVVTFDPLMETDEGCADKIFEALDGVMKTKETENKGSSNTDSVFDEGDEWADIDAIMQSFGGKMVRESVFVRDLQSDFTKGFRGNKKILDVGQWLDSFEMGHYENTLVANGFDDLDFLGGNIMEEQDLEKIGIESEADRKKIIDAAKKIPPIKPIAPNNMPKSVEDWLTSLRLTEYIEKFISKEFNTMTKAYFIWEVELTNILDVTSIGHRKRILASLGERQHERKASDDTLWKLWAHGNSHSPFGDLTLFRDYTGVRAFSSSEDDTRSPSSTMNRTDSSESERSLKGTRKRRKKKSSKNLGTVHVRPPNMVFTQCKDWPHKPEVLVKGCVNYTSQYLGSAYVKELRGTTSTEEGIKKMKQKLWRKIEKSTMSIDKVPYVILSMSYQGVKFIDGKSKQVICTHEIINIFCACQDGEDMNFFAYITKDSQTNKHYCHVFSVKTKNLAREIILTLGEAFEVAYQIAMREKEWKSTHRLEESVAEEEEEEWEEYTDEEEDPNQYLVDRTDEVLFPSEGDISSLSSTASK